MSLTGLNGANGSIYVLFFSPFLAIFGLFPRYLSFSLSLLLVPAAFLSYFWQPISLRRSLCLSHRQSIERTTMNTYKVGGKSFFRKTKRLFFLLTYSLLSLIPKVFNKSEWFGAAYSVCCWSVILFLLLPHSPTKMFGMCAWVPYHTKQIFRLTRFIFVFDISISMSLNRMLHQTKVLWTRMVSTMPHTFFSNISSGHRLCRWERLIVSHSIQIARYVYSMSDKDGALFSVSNFYAMTIIDTHTHTLMKIHNIYIYNLSDVTSERIRKPLSGVVELLCDNVQSPGNGWWRVSWSERKRNGEWNRQSPCIRQQQAVNQFIKPERQLSIVSQTIYGV